MILHVAALTFCALGLVQANDFASQLYSSVAASQLQSNIVISPYLVRASLALLYLGSEGKTAHELRNLLHLHGFSQQTDVREFKDTVWNINNPHVKLLTIFRLFSCDRYTYKPTFQYLASTHMLSSGLNVDCSNGIRAGENISSLVESATDSKFEEIVSRNDIRKWTKSLLVQGFYFNGTFATPFLRFPEPQDFFYKLYKTTAVSYYKAESLLVGPVPQLGGEGIEIPYKNSNLCLLIVKTPARFSEVKELESALRNINLLTLSANFKRERVFVQLPGFKIEFKTDLSVALVDMGFKTIFEQNKFPLLSTESDFEISGIKHKGVIEVNTDNDQYGDGSSADPYDVSFIVNRPFLFAIKDQFKVYFVGRVTKP